MRLGAAFWIQRTSWTELKAAVLAAEAAGWDSVWMDDHLLCDEGDWRDPKLEGWSAIAGIAAVSERVRLGLLVSSVTFRNPGLIAKLATTLDHVSSGRAILGLGGGWFAREHDAFGIDFGHGFGERLDRLDEAVMLIRRLMDGDEVTHRGTFYRFSEAVCTPRPVQLRLPILIGGSGPTKTLRTTARYADMWNGFGSPARIRATSDVLHQRCREVGRSFDSIERTVTINAVIRDTEAAAQVDWRVVAESNRIDPDVRSDDVASVANGPPERIADVIREYQSAGIVEVMVVFRPPYDLETIERLAEVRAGL